jgi:hypothetical protein
MVTRSHLEIPVNKLTNKAAQRQYPPAAVPGFSKDPSDGSRGSVERSQVQKSPASIYQIDSTLGIFLRLAVAAGS